jgi:hypothetical protein
LNVNPNRPALRPIIRAGHPWPNSVHDGTSLYLTSAAFIFAATYALAAVIIIEPVHLSLGIDFISRSSGQSAGSGSGNELAANHR